MKRRHHTPEQAVRMLREADRILGDGRPVVYCVGIARSLSRRITAGRTPTGV